MDLNYNQIVGITNGAVRVEETEEGIVFHRFTEEQEAYYKARPHFHPQELMTAGIRLWFRTNSKSLSLKIKVEPGAGERHYFAHDVLVNGRLIGYLGNFEEADMIGKYTGTKGKFGDFSKDFAFGEGEKEVCVQFPWSARSVLKMMSLDDNAYFVPVKKKQKLLVFGDSITQGLDAIHPSNRYASKLADALDAEEFCKAIAGTGFCPGLAKLPDTFMPDYITVAYGTNDWNGISREDFIHNCRSFFEALTQIYPGVKTFAITPIWRKSCKEERCFGNFEDVADLIAGIVKAYPQVTFINGRNFLPEDETLYGDFSLHPNDRGFEYFYKNLIEYMRIVEFRR